MSDKMHFCFPYGSSCNDASGPNLIPMATMRAVAQLGTAFEVTVIDRPVPTIINATDAIIKINASAICGSDLHTFHQSSGSVDLPYLYGHEAIGMVVAVGDAVEYVNIGDYVIIPDNTDPGHFTVAPPSYYPPLGYGGPADGSVLLGVQCKCAACNVALGSVTKQSCSRV
jgi:threonine dehydrogenase-like Zn-dependent dehydrogenase